jgi:GGDEF domain-containing protein
MKVQQISKKREAPLTASIIAAICIVIYLFAMVQAAVRIYLSVDQRKITADQEFSRLHALAISAASQSFMDDYFIQSMKNGLSSTRSIEAVIVSAPEGDYAFERHEGRAVTWVNNSARFINRLGFSNQPYNRDLQISNVRNASIRAVADAFDYLDFAKILKQTLLIILIGFAIAFFTMLIQLLLSKPEQRPVYNIPVKPESARVPVNEPSFSPSPARQTSPAPVYSPADETVPKGLYSPRSNIGWEEYITDRLDSELHRCSSTEKDLVLIFMEFDITNDDMYRQAAEEAVSFFTSRDLLFEFGDYGVTAILPGIDLEAGITKAEKFYQRIIEKFPNGFNSRASLYIGLSSRSGRLLNADRLLFESGEALQKAKKSPRTPIIAFKSDPEKYRAFIASQS